MLTALVAPWCPPAALVLAHLAGAACWWVAMVARVAAAAPGAQLAWAPGAGGIVAMAGTVLAVAALLLHRGARRDAATGWAADDPEGARAATLSVSASSTRRRVGRIWHAVGVPSPRRSTARTAPAGIAWQDAPVAPVVLVSGSEALLAERAVDRIVQQVRSSIPDVAVERLDAAEYTAGALAVMTSPSLFSDDKVVVLEGLERGSDELLADATAYLGAPLGSVVVVLRHGGGARGKRLLDACKAANVPTVGADPIKSDADKVAFAAGELRRAGRRADPGALRALVDAVGSDLRELAAACAQLVADTTGLIGAETVQRYHGGRVEATGFQVADAAVVGDAGRAVALLRHALSTGLDPVPIVAALAARLRVLAKVGAVRSRGAAAARELGLAPWQVDRAATELRRWTPEGLALAIGAVAQADAEVKGEGRDAQFAVERAVLRIAAAVRR